MGYMILIFIIVLSLNIFKAIIDSIIENKLKSDREQKGK
jgi:hypothetical protein